jgi:hypothetical protein
VEHASACPLFVARPCKQKNPVRSPAVRKTKRFPTVQAYCKILVARGFSRAESNTAEMRLHTLRKKPLYYFVIPSEARNLSFFPWTSADEGFLAALEMRSD